MGNKYYYVKNHNGYNWNNLKQDGMKKSKSLSHFLIYFQLKNVF